MPRSLSQEQVVKLALPVFLADCGWGDDGKEKLTKRRFAELAGQSASGVVLILYDCETGLAVSSDLLCSRWSGLFMPRGADVFLDHLRSESKLPFVVINRIVR